MSDTETGKFSVWDYFEKCKYESYKAECLLCHKVLGCSTSHNLKHHLKCVHSDEVDVNKHLLTSTRKREKGARTTKELVNKAFTKVEGDKVAMCNLCHKILSYRTTIANLKHHLTHVHRDQYSKLQPNIKTEAGDDDYDDEDEHEDTSFQVIEEEDDSIIYSPEINNSNRKRKYEQEDSDIYTEVIYLEEEPTQKQATKKYNSIMPPKKTKKLFTKRRMMSHDDNENQSSDEDLRIEQNTVSNELDKFGQYIATLLASMPKHMCTKLQMNIVNQIMEEKLKVETEKISVAPKTSTRKIVAVENTDVQDNNERHYEVSDEQEAEKKYPKYIITENADIVKND